MNIDTIRNAFRENKALYTKHAKSEMENEEFGQIYDAEIEQAIDNGQIIEEYLTDKPYPSYLIFGQTSKKRPLHAVCAWCWEDELAIVVTVYQPDPVRWIEFKKRR